MEVTLYRYEDRGQPMLSTEIGSTIKKKVKSILLGLEFERDKKEKRYFRASDVKLEKKIVLRFQKKGVKVRFEELNAKEEYKPATVELYADKRTCWTVDQKGLDKDVLERVKELGFKWTLRKKQYEYPGKVKDVKERAEKLKISFKVSKPVYKSKGGSKSVPFDELKKVIEDVVAESIKNSMRDVVLELQEIKKLLLNKVDQQTNNENECSVVVKPVELDGNFTTGIFVKGMPDEYKIVEEELNDGFTVVDSIEELDSNTSEEEDEETALEEKVSNYYPKSMDHPKYRKRRFRK